jgi:class 3 adenylate cyclase/tetratricopeptide (TPR) repeat protein
MNVPLQALSSFLPDLVAEALVGPSLPFAPDARRMDGAVLFADISGFTRLTTKLASRGKIGAELVRGILNRSFDAIIREVTERNGDVLDFDGDAIIAIWRAPTEPDGLAHVCALAAECAQAIQRSSIQEGVTFRVGVAAGPLYLTVLGAPNARPVFLTSGHTFVHVGRVSRRCTPGSVALDPAVEAMLQTAPQRVVRLSPRTRPSIPDAQLRQHLQPLLVQRVEAGQLEWLSELRTVSVVFIIVHDVDAATPEGRAQLQLAVCTVQETLAHWDGELNQVLADDTGHVLLAAFGLPSVSHEDDPTRAATAAFSIEAILARRSVRCTVGVATGRAYCGAYGNDRRRRYAIVGEVVNLAARLAQRDGSGVRCDETTQARAAGRVSFEEHPSQLMKGQTHPTRIFVPTGLQTAPRMSSDDNSVLVGRGPEMAAIDHHLRSESPPGPIVVEGEAGIGKTTLTEHLIRRQRGLGVDVSIGHGDSVEAATAWYPWRSIILELFGCTSTTDPRELGRRVLERVNLVTGMSEWAALLNAVLPVDLPESEITSRMTGQVRGRALTELLLTLFREDWSNRKRMIVLDDAHWFDSTSWEFAAALARTVETVLIMVVMRPMDGDAPEGRTALQVAPRTLHVKLVQLDQDATAAVASLALGVSSVPRSVVEFIFRRAEGNPLFTKELARALREGGHIVVQGQTCELASTVADLESLEFPATVQGIVAHRMDSLNPSQALTLKVSSVLGRIFGVGMLLGVYPVDLEHKNLDAELTSLVAMGFMQTHGDPNHGEFTFQHRVFQDAAYGTLPFGQRRQLHGSAAAWLEGQGEETIRSSYAVLAHHLRHADEPLRCVHYLEKAGDAALGQGSNHEAIAHFNQALDVARGLPVDAYRVAHWHGQLGDGFYGLGKLDQSRHQIHFALGLLRAAMPTTALGWVWRGTVESCRQVWYLATPSVWHLSRSPRQREAQARAAHLISILGEEHYFFVELPQMITAEVYSVNLATRAGAAAIAARPYGALGYLVGLMRLHGLAARYFRHGKVGNDARAIANAYVAESLYHMAFGDWQACRRALEEGIALTRSVGDQFSYSLLLNVRADAEHSFASADVALASYEELIAIARATHNPQHEIWGLTGAAETLATLNRLDASSRYLDEVQARLEGADKLSVIRYWGVRAYVHLKTGENAEATVAAQNMLGFFARTPAPMYAYAWAIAGADQVGRTLPRWSATALLTRALSRLFAVAFPFARRSSLCGERGWTSLYDAA